MESVSETILGQKIGMKNDKMENWCKNPISKKFLGQKIGIKNYFQEIGLTFFMKDAPVSKVYDILILSRACPRKTGSTCHSTQSTGYWSIKVILHRTTSHLCSVWRTPVKKFVSLFYSQIVCSELHEQQRNTMVFYWASCATFL